MTKKIDFDIKLNILHSNLIEGVSDRAEIIKSVEAWEYLLAQPAPLTNIDIMNIHIFIMKNLLRAEDLGLYRRWNVQVGDYTAPSHLLVPDLMDEWCSEMIYYQDLDPKQMHIKYERIHPFRDGNGRTGRMLMWWHEYKLGLEPTVIDYRDRFDYYHWFDTKYA